MKIVFLIYIITFSKFTLADAVTRAALSNGQKALFSYPITRKFKKDTEKYLFSFLPMEKDKIAIVGGIGLALVSGSISTRNFRNLSVGFLGWRVAPEINFNIRSGQLFTLVGISKDF
jgi:hypothetical protein